MRLKDATNTIIFEDKRRWLFLILYGFFWSLNIVPSLRLELNNSSVPSPFLRLYFRKLRPSLIIFLSISMRVILPISLLLSAVVALTVSRSLPSSRCLLSHYVPGSFVILCRDTCVHMHQHTFIHVYSFFSFYPLIASRPSSCEYDIS